MSRWPIAEDAELRILSHDNAVELFEAVERNRARLGEYLPWVHLTHAVADVEGFIAGAAAQHSSQLGFHAGIFLEDRLVGCAGMHAIDRPHRNVSIGYWIDAAAEGRGLVTRAAGELVRICFTDYGLHRVEIRCAVGNERSRAIALRLGFGEEGILRGAQLVNGRWLDLHVFGRLATD
jgi:ribosomal-protein-serine acetyltransferase